MDKRKELGALVSVKCIRKNENAAEADRLRFVEQCRRLKPDSGKGPSRSGRALDLHQFRKR